MMKDCRFYPRRRPVFLAGLLAAVTFGVLSFAQAGAAVKTSDFDSWWNGPQLTGDWFGVRDTPKDRGLTLGGNYRGALFGVVASQNGFGTFWDQEVSFSGRMDFSKLLGASAIRGLEGFVEGRWRESNDGTGNPNGMIAGSTMFNPTFMWSGVGWRMLSFGAQYTTPELFGAKEFLTLRGGWLRPQKEFIDQPLSKLFLNNAINSSKGVGGNIPLSSSFSAWGGTLQAEPVQWCYTKAGLFMTYPDATSSENHGLQFQGDVGDPLQNSLLFAGETGFLPEIGPSRLPGKYAFGTYIYGDGDKTRGTEPYGFYWQADQMIFRELSPASFLSPQGLRLFSLASFAPPDKNLYPFYAQTGLVYEGLLPTRDQDQLIAGVAYGRYANKSGANYTMVFEGGYRVQISGWSYVQPYIQYISHPAGTTQVANAAIFGFLIGVDF